MNKLIGIQSYTSVSSLGINKNDIHHAYFNNKETYIKKSPFNNDWAATISKKSEHALNKLIITNPKYRRLDRCTQLAILAADQLDASILKENVGVNIGSSRGATNTLENAHKEFLTSGIPPFLSSPLTTMGNIATNVARHLQSRGPAFSHSITCSTAMQSLLNAVQWIKAESLDQFIVGGAEAPLTKFTIEQMKRLDIYSKDKEDKYPCDPLRASKDKNKMVLGEAAACFLIEKFKNNKTPLAFVDGLGYSMEYSPSMTGITKTGQALKNAMQMAINDSNNKNDIDLIILHAPGTTNGEIAEINAIEAIFGKNHPILYSNKWLIGHTLGASGAMSMDLAMRSIELEKAPQLPYPNIGKHDNRKVKKVMINTIGFGGNASSAILSHPDIVL